jgi:Type I site-specific restriction-modification system, R (restriction) subunit and related helicases
LGWFQDAGWRFAHGPDIAPDSSASERTDYRQVVLRERLLTALARINPHIPPAALEQAAHALQTVSEPQMVVRNRSVHRLLLGGLLVEFAVGDEKKADLVHFIDFAQPSNNDFLVVNQFTITGTKQPRRPDVIAFINGLPLVLWS